MTNDNKSPDNMRDYLDTAAVAARVGRCEATIRRWIKQHGLRAAKIASGPWLVSRQALDTFLDSHGASVAPDRGTSEKS
jgi:excisionase family DNA binding protein